MINNFSFSIIVPYFNTDICQVKKCLESLLNQNWSYLKEIIVVNDGSNEKNKNNLINIVDDLNTHAHTHACTSIDRNDEIKKHNPLIRIIHQENLGLSTARKTGFQNSTGDIILFVDSDDWIIDDKCLFKLNKCFIDEDIDIVNFNCIDIVKENSLIPKTKKIKYVKKTLNFDWYFNEKLHPKAPISVWVYAYRKKFLEKNIELWNTLKLPFEDYYFNSIILSKELKGIETNEIFYAYRKFNKNSITDKTSKISVQQKLQLLLCWFTSFSNWNIENLKCKEYWTSIFIETAVSSVGFRKLIKITEANNIFCPNMVEIKQFVKKYKFYTMCRRVYMLMCIKNSILDYLLPQIYKIVMKHKKNK